MLDKQMICVAGLPRGGSTLLCQLLNEHPDIFASGHSSPVCNMVEVMRNKMGADPLMLSQLDVEPEMAYERLRRGMRGFVDGWLDESECTHVVDKNRQWLMSVETLAELKPNFKMIVCIRNLVDVFASVEKRHRETILLPFPDRMEPNHVRGRMASLFGPGGVVGSALLAIANLNDIPNRSIVGDNIYYVAYEALAQNPIEVMNGVYEFVGAGPFNIDPHSLEVRPHESDSHYKMKYSHKTRSQIKPSFHSKIELSTGVAAQIIRQNRWFYKQFYPGILQDFEENK